MDDITFGSKKEHRPLAKDVVLFARKKFMTTKFNRETGSIFPCTVLEVEPNYITGVADHGEKRCLKISGIHDKGGSEKSIINRIGKPAAFFYKKAGVAPMRKNLEISINSIDEGYTVGSKIFGDIFQQCSHLDISGVTKGKGYQGTMKLHGFSGGPASHGSSRFHRGRGSVGVGRSSPGTCFKNTKMASRMGGRNMMAENIQLLEILKDTDIEIPGVIKGTVWLVIKGSIPGSNSSVLKVCSARKKQK